MRRDVFSTFTDRAAMRPFERSLGRIGNVIVLDIEVVVVARNIAGLLATFEFFAIALDDSILNHLSTGRIDRMGDVRIEFGSPVGIHGFAVMFEFGAAVIAVVGSQMILRAAQMAMGGELATGHRDKRTIDSFNDLQIADDECVVERDAAETLQAIVRVIHQLDANLGDFHGNPSVTRDPSIMSIVELVGSEYGQL